ncbi:DUF2267 domain-containing protein [Saccharomonospora iraqiensis]|uniref:DUF2267 domain-containing protein n=1 Tax=Saccharomonospora iraqiensis TaxID=52698 RepID=UPI00041FF542|nr:DUF2267 domain-containing protein [Saccharomonospora iraqiensis]
MQPERSQQMTEFAEKVRERAGIDNVEEADQLSRACAQVLGETISGGQAENLALQLPDELGAELAAQRGQASSFDKAQFLEKVGGKILSVDTDRVERQVAAVFATIRETTRKGELNDTLAQLPPELTEMFDREKA